MRPAPAERERERQRRRGRAAAAGRVPRMEILSRVRWLRSGEMNCQTVLKTNGALIMYILSTHCARPHTRGRTRPQGGGVADDDSAAL
eukprot:479192-Prymnesium_polylepis.1